MTLLLLLNTAAGGGGDTILVSEPAAGDRLLVGETVSVQWAATGGSGQEDVLLSLDGGATFPITLATAVDSPYSWTITSAHITAEAVIRVRDTADALIVDDSDEFIVATTTPGSGAASPPLCAVTFHVRDQFGDDLADVPIEITFIQFTADAVSSPPVLSPVSLQETDADGLLTVDLYRDAKYKAIFGTYPTTRRVDFTVPDAGSYEVGE